MYFLRLEPLKNQLARTGLSESERFRYLLGTVLLGLVAVETSGDGSDAGGRVVQVFFDAVLLIYAYWRNGRARGRDFLSRFTSVSFVIGCRVALIMLLVTEAIKYVPLLDALMRVPDNAINYLRAMSSPDADLEDVEHAGVALLALPLLLYATWAVGYHVGKVRQLTESGPVPGGAWPPAPGALPAIPAGATATDRNLERFVETVIQRESAAAPPPPVAGGLTLHRRPARRRGLSLHRKKKR